MCIVCAMHGTVAGKSLGHFPTTLGIKSLLLPSAYLTGNTQADALVWGYSWTGKTGLATTVKYNIDSSLGSSYKANIDLALAEWSKVANVSFQYTTSSSQSQMTFNRMDLDVGTLGLAELSIGGSSGRQIRDTVVHIDDEFSAVSSINVGTQGFRVLLHEIGHALGLKHTRNYGEDDTGSELTAAQDHLGASVMSYYDASVYSGAASSAGEQITDTVNASQTVQFLDIIAIQHLYGAKAFATGNNTYTLDGSNKTMTIYDTGGVDTIATTVTTGVKIDLRAGIETFSDTGNNTFWIANGVSIENATGGTGADTLVGNSLNNTLSGNNGNDTIDGGDGADTIWGGNENDLIRAGNDNDLLYGQAGNDELFGNAGADLLLGEAGNDVLYGDGVTLALTDRSDTLSGGSGNDTLYGMGGNDVFVFTSASGLDTIVDFTGEGAAVGDVIRLHGIAGFTNFANVQAAMTYNSSTQIAAITFSAGNVLTIQSVSTALVASDFLFT